MSVSHLSPIPPIVSREIPPEGSRVIGSTPDGRVLYERTLVRGRNVPKRDEEGNEVWELHPTTAQPLYPRRKLERVETKQQFTLRDALNGHVYIEPYVAPTEAELREVEVTRRAGEIRDQLARAMAEQNIGVSDILAAVKPKRGKQQQATDEDIPAA